MTAVERHAAVRRRGAIVQDPARPLLVELVGVAGAGKTTLVRAVLARIAGARAGLRLHRARDIPAVAVAAGRVAPALFTAMLRRSPSAAHDAHYSLRLLAHRAPAARALSSGSRLVLVDEGPVYMLARLIAFGSPGADRGAFSRHWERSFEWWRSRLDAVVWLDAPDETLAARIRGRLKDHRVKYATDAALGEFLARYRASYATVIGRLAAAGGVRIIRLDSREPVDTGVGQLLNTLRIATVQPLAADGD